MHRPRRIRHALAVVVASGATCAVAQPELTTLPMTGGLRIMRLDDAGGASSPARLIEGAGAGKRVAREEGGWVITRRIAVRAESADRVRAHVARMGDDAIGVRVVQSDVPGFVIVESPSVRVAGAVANRLWSSGAFESVEMVAGRPRALRSPIGELLNEQWHLRNFENTEADVNATPAWNLGYSGSGVIIGIVEGGFQESHPDLAPNYVPAASIPTVQETRHATSVAGIAAASGTNTEGGAGLAYNAGIASQYYGNTSETTATALGFASDLTDIKSNSWGPLDLRRLEPIPAIELAAIENAATNGRAGLGTVFTWAAGNGGPQDRVDYDSWASNRHTIAVGAIGYDDAETIYNELGSSMFVVAHSDGGGQMITTTDLVGAAGYSPGDYTNNFGGTSAACPLAAGAVALALEANPGLTRRDVMHLLADTARLCDPSDPSWTVNGAGRHVSEKFGFGAVDAGALVSAALAWDSVGPETMRTSGIVAVNEQLPDNTGVGVSRTVGVPGGVTIEAVELVLNATSEFIGDVEIMLTSPDGTESVLARKRPDATSVVDGFVFTSFRHWGEDSGGEWTVTLTDLASFDLTTWIDFEIRVYGTSCPAEINGDGVLDNGDIASFVALFLSGDIAADINADGVLDNGDVGAFVAAFLAGC
ncbi:MAG: S8 family serine peptidase [Phycisphaerales bacterium JB040]